VVGSFSPRRNTGGTPCPDCRPGRTADRALGQWPRKEVPPALQSAPERAPPGQLRQGSLVEAKEPPPDALSENGYLAQVARSCPDPAVPGCRGPDQYGRGSWEIASSLTGRLRVGGVETPPPPQSLGP
jgi:hypothetical protein